MERRVSNSTVVSTLPILINEIKPGLVPSTFIIEPAPKGSFSKLVVGVSYHFVLNNDPDLPPYGIPEKSEIIAESIVTDLKGSLMGTRSTRRSDGFTAMPGIFWIPGEPSDEVIKTKHKDILASAFGNTKAWCQELVKIADDEWNKNRQRGMITDLQRVACAYLGLEKEWDVTVLLNQSAQCWACKSSIHPDTIVCPNCKAITNKELYEKNKGQFVGT
jgi:hypothetical protein